MQGRCMRIYARKSVMIYEILHRLSKTMLCEHSSPCIKQALRLSRKLLHKVGLQSQSKSVRATFGSLRLVSRSIFWTGVSSVLLQISSTCCDATTWALEQPQVAMSGCRLTTCGALIVLFSVIEKAWKGYAISRRDLHTERRVLLIDVLKNIDKRSLISCDHGLGGLSRLRANDTHRPVRQLSRPIWLWMGQHGSVTISMSQL
ncbi:hypothetical protein ABKN59_009936 [Abortiporus biennis]